ncbi:MAG TPA: type I polyketide synthase, partial [Pseudonocardiaceae bacterium]|nr:type I polyketide synthase [Pseudonocardiaceae bacterium]
MTRIAIVGMACRYPDASSPRELWENIVAGRRAFRRLPDERMRLEDYWDPDPKAPDKFYARNAAVIEGYEFDRVKYKIAGSTYRSTDLTHWLALDIAAQALADAGFPMGDGMPRERTGVLVGNSLTGEFSRANLMRLRWPYVRRTVAAALREKGWDDDELATFLEDLEGPYKSAFPPIDEDTLAGGLSNTIPGRICNYFDFNGGGYTVDGACSSSLLAVATACKAIADGELDAAVAGGVDLSIDPFEIIGFAKTGALARHEVRIYDRGSNGFWPGEGCGMVVLMREEEARSAGHRVYATVPGWGISSDGKGGITRPEVSGYRLALRRAYNRAGFGIETVPMFEGHATGTAVGDATELRALTAARREADASAPPAAVSSIKGMIGHTKAAAGVAGLIKAVMAVHNQVLPPSVGSVDPHEVLTEDRPALRVLRKAEPWPKGAPLRAGVTGMGFGGINAHVVVENPVARRRNLDARAKALATSLQDVELLMVDGATTGQLRERVAELADFVGTLAYAQVGDLAETLQRELRERPYRAAVVASSPEDAARRLRQVLDAIDAGETSLFSADGRVFLGRASGPVRIGYLFPGQGSGRGVSGGALRRRFAEADEVYTRAALPTGADVVATAVAQPRIVTGSMAGLRVLASLGLDATLAVGHSLGEITALHWAGAMDEDTLLQVASVRGRVMTDYSASGTMAGIAAGAEAVEPMIAGTDVVIAGYNGPNQTVIAGPVDSVKAVGAAAAKAGLEWTLLSVSHAFHSPLVAPAADAFAERLREEYFGPVGGHIVSTVTGDPLPPGLDVPELLRRQITDPVLFAQAVERAAKDVDLFVEVGPGRVLSRMTNAIVDVPAIALDTDDESLAGVLRVVAATFVAGVDGVQTALFHGRLTKPLSVGQQFKFFASPCEHAPTVTLREPVRRSGAGDATAASGAPAAEKADQAAGKAEPGESSLDLLRRLVAERAELPIEMVREDSRLLDDLSLSSISVGQVVNAAAQQLGVSAAQAPTNFATSTVRELADALQELADTAGEGGSRTGPFVAGAAPWARPFRIDLDEVRLPRRPAPAEAGAWQVLSGDDHPFALRLGKALESANTGTGVLVCLPAECTERDVLQVLAGAKEAAAGAKGIRFVLVQHGRGAAGLAKTLSLEAPHVRVTIVHTPVVEDVVERVVAEVAATTGYTEVFYDEAGVRRVPTLRAMPVHADRTELPLGDGDVLLVTGGGKGITAECALAVAADSGAKLAVLGRSDPAADTELAANLERMANSGVTVSYARADVTDPAAVSAAVGALVSELGPVTAVLHGAGRNEPGALTTLDDAAFERTFAPKIGGLRAVLAAVDCEQIKLLVTFGSIIGRAGLRGEAHYSTANEWLADLTTEFGERHPGCKALCMEWSVWSGVGMGERLSVVESLSRDGVTPISPDQGVAIMRRLVGDPDAPPVVVISGRTEGVDTVRYDEPELPLLRFVDKALVRYHGVELVVETQLTAGTDLYLADHLLDGNLLFPAVFGMEAMAQVGSAATGSPATPVIEQAEFLRPIVVAPNGSTTIRVAATVTGGDAEGEEVALAIRSAETDFATDHFRATLRFTGADAPEGPPEQIADGLPLVPLDPATELYGDTLFQGTRFQRLRRFHRAAARHVDVDVAAIEAPHWFAGFLPSELLLGDPGMRDALMHGNQVCVPDGTLLPAGIERIYPGGAKLTGAGEVRFCATERKRTGDTYIYDIAVRNAAGEMVER